MFEPHDKKTKGGSRTGGPTSPDTRRVVQPLSVVRGSRPQPPAASPERAMEAEGTMAPVAAETAQPQYAPTPGVPSSTLLQLWAMLNQRHRWSSLVVVPSHAGGSGLQAVQAILEVASRQSSTPLHFLDAEGWSWAPRSTWSVRCRRTWSRGTGSSSSSTPSSPTRWGWKSRWRPRRRS
ncbi:hypothetical protein ACN28S_57515 [Cystobacter fuscus]